MGGFANNAPIVTDGLVFYVDAGNSKSYPGSGTTWTDMIGGNDGSLTNMDATNHSSANGGIFTFDGSNEYVGFGDVLDLGTNDLTISTWAKLTSNLSANFAVFAGKAFAGNGNRYALALDSSNKIATLIADTTSGIISTGTSALSLNTWYMITAVFDRSSNVSFYINNVSDTVASNPDISSKASSDLQDTVEFRVGSYAQADRTTPFLLFPGNIATTLVYFKALSSAEVLQNYNALKNRFV
jgi:hypothetical protein